MAREIVLAKRTFPKPPCGGGGGEANGRLAMMEMRVTLARLIWQYDISLKTEGQEEPAFFHRAVAAGQLEVRIRRVERS
jgi:hypothetical protein